LGEPSVKSRAARQWEGAEEEGSEGGDCPAPSPGGPLCLLPLVAAHPVGGAARSSSVQRLAPPTRVASSQQMQFGTGGVGAQQVGRPDLDSQRVGVQGVGTQGTQRLERVMSRHVSPGKKRQWESPLRRAQAGSKPMGAQARKSVYVGLNGSPGRR
jgi:hypothetical protein